MNIKKISSINKNFVFVRLFLCIVGISALSVIILSVSMFYWFRGKTMESIQASDNLAISNIDANMFNFLDSARKSTIQLYQSPFIKRLIYTNDIEWNDNMLMAASSTVSYISANSFVDSIYVFGDSGKVLLKASNSTISEKYEKIFFNKLQEQISLQYFPMVLKKNSTDKLNVISIFMGESSSSSTNKYDNAVMVNIDMDSVKNQILKNPLGDSQDIIIINEQGYILLSKNMNLFSSDISGKPYIKTILNQRNSSGNFISIIANKKYSVSFIHSKIGSYYVIHLQEYGLSVQKLAAARNIILALSVFILLCILFASIVISYRIATPINNIFSNIRNVFNETNSISTDNLNQFQIISNATMKLVERMNSYDKELENRHIRNLFDLSKESSYDDIMSALKQIKSMSGLNTGYCVIVVRISKFSDFSNSNSPEAKSFQKSSIINIASEYLSEATQCYPYEFIGDHSVLVATEKNNSYKITESIVKSLMEKAVDAIYHIYGISVTAGISLINCDPAEIKNQYKNAYSLTNYRLIFGNRAVIANEMIQPEEKNNALQYNISMALEMVKKNSRNEFETILEKIFAILKTYQYEAIKKVIIQTSLDILRIPLNLKVDYSSAKNIDYSELNSRISNIEDFTEFKEWFLKLFDEVSTIISNVNNTRIQYIISKSIEYMDENYSNANITANYIADNLSITPSYFSRIFNEYMGTTFPEYISNLRLEKSRELLSSKKSDISEIAAMVGYSNASYFTAAFKKKYGVTPSKFRLNSTTGNVGV